MWNLFIPLPINCRFSKNIRNVTYDFTIMYHRIFDIANRIILIPMIVRIFAV